MGEQLVVSAVVDETVYCVYNKTEQLVYQLLIKLMITQTSTDIFQLQQWKHN
jgi:hypothetical protein